MKNLLLFSFTALLLLFVACKSNENNDPKNVLNHFFEALAKKDVTEAKKYVTKDSEGMMGMVEMGMKNAPDSTGQMMYNKENMTMGNPVINGDQATVPVKDKRSGEETDFVLKKENGAWKVAFDKSTLMEMAQKKMKEHGMNEMGMDSTVIDSLNRDTIHQADSIHAYEKTQNDKVMDSAENILEKMKKKGR